MIDTRTSRRTPARRPASCRLRVEVVKNSVAACWSGEGPVATSMIVWTPGRAWSSPSPVVTSTPSERAIGTTSWPRDSRMSTTGRPTRPVAPATAIFVLGFISCLLGVGCVSLHGHAAARRCDRTGHGSLQQDPSLTFVAGERRRQLEFAPGLVAAAQLLQQVAADAWEQVVAVEGSFGYEVVHDLQAGLGTEGHRYCHRPVQFHHR